MADPLHEWLATRGIDPDTFDPANIDPARWRGESESLFVLRLVDRVPALRPLLDEHIADYDIVLAHLFFGDVTRWVVASYGAGGDQWRGVVDFLEQEYRDCDDDVQAVIEQSFVENLPYPHEPGYGIEGRLGPRLSQLYHEQRPQ